MTIVKHCDIAAVTRWLTLMKTKDNVTNLEFPFLYYDANPNYRTSNSYWVLIPNFGTIGNPRRGLTIYLLKHS